jgi:hypothetical protein
VQNYTYVSIHGRPTYRFCIHDPRSAFPSGNDVRGRSEGYPEGWGAVKTWAKSGPDAEEFRFSEVLSALSFALDLVEGQRREPPLEARRLRLPPRHRGRRPRPPLPHPRRRRHLRCPLGRPPVPRGHAPREGPRHPARGERHQDRPPMRRHARRPSHRKQVVETNRTAPVRTPTRPNNAAWRWRRPGGAPPRDRTHPRTPVTFTRVRAKSAQRKSPGLGPGLTVSRYLSSSR